MLISIDADLAKDTAEKGIMWKTVKVLRYRKISILL